MLHTIMLCRLPVQSAILRKDYLSYYPKRNYQYFSMKTRQHRILARDVEDYLAPIYRTEARFVVCFLSPDYPKRVWTRFESRQFKERFGQDSVIPIWFTTAPPGTFDESARV